MAMAAGNALYPGSLDKLARMRWRLAEHDFTRFAEAEGGAREELPL
jgi:hypothetical protein